MFASYMSDHFRIVYVRAYCSIYVKIVLIMKDGGFADKSIGWMCPGWSPLSVWSNAKLFVLLRPGIIMYLRCVNHLKTNV